MANLAVLGYGGHSTRRFRRKRLAIHLFMHSLLPRRGSVSFGPMASWPEA